MLCYNPDIRCEFPIVVFPSKFHGTFNNKKTEIGKERLEKHMPLMFIKIWLEYTLTFI